MAEINLLQNRLTDTTNSWKKQGRLILTLLSIVLVGLMVGALVLFFLNQGLKTESATVTSDNQTLQSKLNDQQNSLGDAKAFQAQLVNLRTLIDNHAVMTPLMDELNKVTYTRTQYNTVDINETRAVHIEGRVDSYADLGKVLLGLSTSSQFNNVRLLSVLPSTGTSNGYQFSIDLTALTGIFTKK